MTWREEIESLSDEATKRFLDVTAIANFAQIVDGMVCEDLKAVADKAVKDMFEIADNW